METSCDCMWLATSCNCNRGDRYSTRLSKPMETLESPPPCKYMLYFTMQAHSFARGRYNVYERVKTLLKKKKNNKKVDLEKTFFPRRKRVLNRTHALPVLNKPEKKKNKAGSEDTTTVDDILNSQCSISTCFFDSQGRFPPCTVWVALKAIDLSNFT